MLPALFAQWVRPMNWSFGELAIFIVIVAAVCAIVWVAIKRFGLNVPGWIVQVFWIVVAAVVCIVAIRFVLSI